MSNSAFGRNFWSFAFHFPVFIAVLFTSMNIILPKYPIRLHCDQWTVRMFNLMLGIVALPSLVHMLIIPIKNKWVSSALWVMTLAPFALPILYQPSDYCQKFTPTDDSFYTPELIRDIVEKAPMHFLIMMIVQHAWFLIRLILCNVVFRCQDKLDEKEVRADVIAV